VLVASRGPVGGLQNALLPVIGWLPSEQTACRISAAAWLENRTEHSISSGLPAAAFPSGNQSRRFRVFVIGIDPHKGSHSAVVLDQHEQLVGELRVRARRRQREELVAFASRFAPRCWAIEGATGTGALLRNSSSRSARPCSMSHPRCRPELGCSTQPGSTRPTRTTPAPRRWSRYVTRSCGP
jgi:hypothetical protein